MAVNVHVIECNGPPTGSADMVGQHWIDSASLEMWFSISAGNGVADWILLNTSEAVFSVAVGAGATVNLHTVALANFCSIRYQICVHDDAETVWRSLQLYGSKATASTVDDSIYTILGSAINLDLNFKVVATDAVLEAINNEAFPITVKFRVETI